MKRLPVFVFCLLLISGFAGGTEEKLLPDYQNWTLCYGEISKLCFDNIPSLANNVVTEYRDKDTKEKDLLIWQKMERSEEVFSMHGQVKSYRVEKLIYRFYVWGDNKWMLSENREFVRDGAPKNTDIPIFEKDSPFGQLYIAHMLRKYTNGKEIKIPTINFR